MEQQLALFEPPKQPRFKRKESLPVYEAVLIVRWAGLPVYRSGRYTHRVVGLGNFSSTELLALAERIRGAGIGS